MSRKIPVSKTAAYKKRQAKEYRARKKNIIASGVRICSRCPAELLAHEKGKCTKHKEEAKRYVQERKERRKIWVKYVLDWNKTHPNEKKCTNCKDPNKTRGNMCHCCLAKSRDGNKKVKKKKMHHNINNPENRLCTAHNCKNIVTETRKKVCLGCRNKRTMYRLIKEEEVRNSNIPLCNRCYKSFDNRGKKCNVCKRKLRKYARRKKMAIIEYNLAFPFAKLCHRCHEPNSTTFDNCDICRHKETLTHSKRKKKLRENSKDRLCIQCDKPNKHSTSLCKKCKERLNTYDMEKRISANNYNKVNQGRKMCYHCNKTYHLDLQCNLCPKCNLVKYNDATITTQLKRGANKRSLAVSLTDNEIVSLSKQNCYYCNAKPPVNKRNGIDRCNNKLGYHKSNVVPCCKMCNRIKYTTDKNDFINKCLQIVCRHEPEFFHIEYNNPMLSECSKLGTIEYHYNSHLYGAKKRNLKNEITYKDYCDLIISKCYYCHKEPNTEKGLRNGIDRAYNDMGYVKGNCVPCCKTCNLCKGPYDYNDYIAKCVEIITNHF